MFVGCLFIAAQQHSLPEQLGGSRDIIIALMSAAPHCQLRAACLETSYM
jgi:hypothetical protein